MCGISLTLQPHQPGRSYWFGLAINRGIEDRTVPDKADWNYVWLCSALTVARRAIRASSIVLIEL